MSDYISMSLRMRNMKHDLERAEDALEQLETDFYQVIEQAPDMEEAEDDELSKLDLKIHLYNLKGALRGVREVKKDL